MPAEKQRQRSSRSSKSKQSFGKRISKSFGNLTEAIEKGFKVFAEATGGVVDMLFSIVFPKTLRKKVDKIGKSKKATRVTKKVGKKVGALTDNVEKTFKSGASGFFEVFGFLFAILVPKFIRDRVTKIWTAVSKRVSKFFKRLGRGISSWAERYLPKWLLQLIKRLNARFRRFRKNASRFSNAWIKSRDFVTLAWSTPAILMALPLFAVMSLAAVNSHVDRQMHYLAAATKADYEGDIEFADLCRKKLSQLGYQQMENTEYRAALELAKSDPQAAYERMKLLAPLPAAFWDGVASEAPPNGSDGAPAPDATDSAEATGESTARGEQEPADTALDIASEGSFATRQVAIDDKPADESDEASGAEDSTAAAGGTDTEEEEDKGFMFAHLWIARMLLLDEVKESSDELRWKLIEEHAVQANELHRVRSGRENDPNFKGLMAYRYFKIKCKQNEGKLVIREMIELATEYPEFSAELMHYYHRLRDYREAMAHASSYINYMGHDKKPIEIRSSAPNEMQYVALIHAYELLNDKKEAMRLVEEGNKYHPEASLLGELKALILRTALLAMHPTDEGYFEKLVELHNVTPEDNEITQRLARRLNSDPAMSDELLQNLEENNLVTTNLLLELGDIEAISGNPYRAVTRYNQALDKDPDSSRAHNNLAYVHANDIQQPGAIDMALKFVNMAIAKEKAATYFETRGQIYLKLNRWEEAAADLEYAINGNISDYDRQKAHESLERIYRHLNMPELEKAHRDQAETYRNNDNLRTRLNY